MEDDHSQVISVYDRAVLLSKLGTHRAITEATIKYCNSTQDVEARLIQSLINDCIVVAAWWIQKNPPKR